MESLLNAKPRLRVLDFTRVLAGPVCTMLLGDYGADVIKVERPGRGDDTRHWGPPWAGSDAARMSAYFLSVNRNKRSLTLNLQEAEGRALARRLALASDVLIENFRVGQMAAWGLDYDTLAAEHPGLVYCSISGYGQAGPRAHEPGYDSVIQAQSGLMAITGEADGEPMKIGVALSDVITGLFATTAIQAALLQREHGGRGQYIDVALLDAQLAAMVNIASNALDRRRGAGPLRQRASQHRALPDLSGGQTAPSHWPSATTVSSPASAPSSSARTWPPTRASRTTPRACNIANC